MSKKSNPNVTKPVQDESIISSLWKSYQSNTNGRVKVIDCFLAYQLLTAFLVLIYGFIFCHNPLNAFLAALFSCVGSFVFTMSLRLRESEQNTSKRYFMEYVFCVILLQLSVANFLG
ncbi:Dolichyl-diphosphooligosaccharide--protein glycosyltransferase subunit OST2 [Entamoeba marina]